MPENNDPYGRYNFKLDIAGITEGHFGQCSAPGIEVEAIPYREAGNSQNVHQIPGKVVYAPVTLSYGLTDDSRPLWDWMMTAAEGKVERKNVSIIMLDRTGATEVMRWNLISAWPQAWRGAPLDALSGEVAIENLTLVFNTLERAA